MKLPNGEVADVPADKIVGYLLSPTHRSGRSKAAFFSKHGFNADEWQALASALRDHAVANPVARSEETAFGTRYIVDGPLAAPDGSALNLRSVWFINGGATVPRFATAHPLERRAR